MENRKDITVPLPAELNDKIIRELEYGDSRAKWVRQAIRLRLNQDPQEQIPDDYASLAPRKDITVPMPAEMNDKITESLGYDDSRSAWIRRAILARFLHEKQDLQRV